MNRSGIDITAGSNEHGIYAGLLIREIDKSDGPAKALKSIVRNSSNPEPSAEYNYSWSQTEKDRIKMIHGQSVVSAPLKLVRRENPIEENLWVGPRLNLEYAWDAELRAAAWETNTKEVSKRLRKASASMR